MRNSFTIKRIILGEASSGESALVVKGEYSQREMTIPCELEEALKFKIHDTLYVATLEHLIPRVGQARQTEDGSYEIWRGNAEGWVKWEPADAH